jgi:hypothetical protein
VDNISRGLSSHATILYCNSSQAMVTMRSTDAM